MYLHLGKDTVLKLSELIGFFDIETTSVGAKTRDFLKKAEQRGQVTAVAEDLPKTFVVCAKERGENRIFLSQISPTTLKGRAGFLEKKVK